MRNTERSQRNDWERGSTTFHALLVFPVLLALAAVGIDLSGWHSSREEIQKFADGIALEAARYLPDTVRAVSFVRTSRLPAHLSSLDMRGFTIGENRLSIGVRISGRFQPRLTTFLPGLSTNSFQVAREAVAQVVPSDTVFILSDGGSLRPRLNPFSDIDPPWGNPEDWPASGYFNCVAPPVLTQTSYPFSWWERWADLDFQRWATQSCFNPVFSALKLGSISLIDSLLTAPENRVGFIFTPGSDPLGGFTVLKHLRREPAFIGSPVRWSGYVEGDRFLGDETCLLFSHPDSSFSERFQLPAPLYPQAFPAEAKGCSNPLVQPPCGERHTPDGHLSRCFIENALSLREAVYWHAARIQLPGFDMNPKILPSLEEAIRELADADHGAEAESLRRVRGNLNFEAHRRIILISDFIPPAQSPQAQTILKSLRQHQISLILVGYKHSGLLAGEIAQLEANLDSWAENERENQRNLRTVLAVSQVDLERRVLPQLPLVDRQIVMRR